jgi:hypothetical protein
MALDEIASVTEGASGLVVRSSRSGSVIRIPRTVEGFVDVRARLDRRRGITARPDALIWCGGLIGSGLVAAATVSIWGRAGVVAAGVLACQASAVFAAGAEIWGHPHLAPRRKLGALAVLVVAAVLPACGLAVRELAS